MKSTAVKFGFINGLVMFFVIITCGLFIKPEILTQWIKASALIGIIIGVVLYYLRSFKFRNKYKYIEDYEFELNKYEFIIIEGIARNISQENDFGKLCLTSERLVFISSPPKKQFNYAIDDMQDVKLFKSFWVYNKGIQFSYCDKEYCIEVEYPSGWLELIKSEKEVKVENLSNEEC